LPIRWYGPSLILLATVVAVMLIGPGLARKIVWSHTEAQITQVREELLGNADLASLSASFSKVSQLVEPSVVHVQTFAPAATGGGFFSRLDPLPQTGSGSGWVYQYTPTDGSAAQHYVITNHHVVAEAKQIRVRFADGSDHVATLVNSDPLTDVAVLRVPDAFLHAAAISLEPVKKGQIVFAFGSPFRFDFSVSQGIVSASGRTLEVATASGKYQDFIQTDAAINPGNSGGPLTDIYGRVVGMNTAIASTRSGANPDDPGGFMGLGFAIPVQMAVDVANHIIEDGEFHRGYLGVFIRDVTPELAEALGYPGPADGVLIEHAIGGGPAAEAGLLPGDIITHVQQQATTDVAQLRYTVAGHAPGKPLVVTAMRGATPQHFTVTLDELPANPTTSRVLQRFHFIPTQVVQDDTLRAFGVEAVADFTEEDARAEGFAPMAGVMILGVRPGSLATGQRLNRHFLITHANRQRVQTVPQLRSLLDALAHNQPLLLTTLTWDPALNEYITRFALFKAK